MRTRGTQGMEEAEGARRVATVLPKGRILSWRMVSAAHSQRLVLMPTLSQRWMRMRFFAWQARGMCRG
jgi:hypothetical protein